MAEVSAPWERFGRGLGQGQAYFDEGQTRMGKALAEQLTAFSAARKTEAELAEMERQKQFRDPKYGNKIAGALAGFTDPQTDEVSTYIERGDWAASDPNFAVPMRLDTAQAPSWASPGALQRFNQARAAQMVGLGGKGDSNAEHFAKALDRFIQQGREDSAFPQGVNSPEDLGALEAARKGTLIDFNEAGVMNRRTGKVDWNPLYTKAKDADISAKNADVSKTRAEIDLINLKTQNLRNGKPEGLNLTKDQRWNAELGRVEAIPGSALDQKQKGQFADDQAAFKNLSDSLTAGIAKINKVLDPTNKAGFEANFGGWNAYATSKFPGARDTAKVIESVKADMKRLGLEAMRSGGSIGAMTNAEWPIIEAQIDAISPDLSEEAARQAFQGVAARMEGLKKRATEKFETEWGNRIPQAGGSAPAAPAAPKMTADEVRESVLKARKAIEKNPAAKAQIIERLEKSGITNHGIL